jgi:hypothetical protein
MLRTAPHGSPDSRTPGLSRTPPGLSRTPPGLLYRTPGLSRTLGVCRNDRGLWRGHERRALARLRGGGLGREPASSRTGNSYSVALTVCHHCMLSTVCPHCLSRAHGGAGSAESRLALAQVCLCPVPAAGVRRGADRCVSPPLSVCSAFYLILTDCYPLEEDYYVTLSRRLETPLGGFIAGGRRLPPSIERLWLGELRRAQAIINIITTQVCLCPVSLCLYEYLVRVRVRVRASVSSSLFVHDCLLSPVCHHF